MSFENLSFGRIIQTVVLIWIVSLILSLVGSCLLLTTMPQDMIKRFSNLLDMVGNQNTTPEQLNAEVTSITHDYGPELNLQYGVQWGITTLVTLWFARRAARRAATPAQAAGTGLVIGLGVAFTYGVACVMLSLAVIIMRLLFFGLFIAAGAVGGRLAGSDLEPDVKPKHEPLAPFAPTPGFGGAPTPGARPETYFNMGVQAALGGRREEARQHFTRVLQMQPRSTAAWLQLANLADTPEQAWNYVQQARSINPTDPDVMHAVDVIWPKVAASAQQSAPPRVQPPYTGGAQDDPDIPRTTLPKGDDSDTSTPPQPPDISPPSDSDNAGDDQSSG
jgi:hypothetical protein